MGTRYSCKKQKQKKLRDRAVYAVDANSCIP